MKNIIIVTETEKLEFVDPQEAMKAARKIKKPRSIRVNYGKGEYNEAPCKDTKSLLMDLTFFLELY